MEVDKEELHWEQRTRVNWLQYGDKNTHFFHSHASYRKRKNVVKGLSDGHGNWLTGEAELLNLRSCFMNKVLKARYYPRSDFMFVELGARPSYICPGDGRVRRGSMDIRHTVVSDLINSGDRVWKHYVVNELLDEEQTSRICSILLSKTSCPYEIIWLFDGSECYRVKSGYTLLMDDQCSNSELAYASLSRFYIALWSANFPSKIKITMWKIVNGFLPMLDNLYNRRLVVNSLCLFCQFPGETVAHLLRDCYFANQLMNSLGLAVSSRSDVEPWQRWLASYFVRLSDINKRLLMVTYWSIWFSRNKLVYDGIKTSVQEASSFITVFLREQDPVGTPTHHISTSGVIGRNSQGLIMAACASPHSDVTAVFVSEAITCKLSVQFPKKLGFSNVVIEQDSLTVFKKINSCAPDRSVIVSIVFDIKELSLGFHSIIFSFVSREANNTTHVLARECRSIQNLWYWSEEAPVGTTATSEVDRGLLSLCLHC
ncbi:hypothetical protein GQ457_13G013290 [Hibiscus cannabinus]